MVPHFQSHAHDHGHVHAHSHGPATPHPPQAAPWSILRMPVASGALLAIVGPNGAGKSTLFRGIAGILKPLAGSIVTGALDIRDIAYLPQSVDIDRSFPISVFDLVGTGLWRRIGFFGGMGKA